MPVTFTAAQVRALGLSPPGDTNRRQAGEAPAPARRKPGGRRHPAPVYRCRDCGTEVVGEAASVRHLADNHHLRYELVLTSTPVEGTR